jgi:hypothetical protein
LTPQKRKYTRKAASVENSAKYAESGQCVAECGERAQKYGKATRVNKPGAGRPPVYSNEVWKSIFDRVGGGSSLTTALKETGLSYTHAYRLMDADPKLAEAYERAKKDRASRLAEEIIELADAPIPEHLQGVEISAWVNQKRLQVDARKWVAAKLHPKVYGDKIDVSVRDDRISVIDALEAARSRVQIGMDVTDITPKLSTGSK